MLREVEELEVPVGLDARRELGEHVRERGAPGALVQTVGPQQTQPHRGHDAERAQGDPRRPEELGVGSCIALHDPAVTRHQAQPGDAGGEVAEGAAGAVGAGRQRAPQRLDVDVPQVRHGHAALEERLAEVVELAARPHVRAEAVGVVGHDPRERIQGHDDAVRRHQRHEGVAGPDGAHHAPLPRRALDQGHQLGLAAGRGELVGLAAHAPGPVLPGDRHVATLAAEIPRARAPGAGVSPPRRAAPAHSPPR